MNFRMSPPSIGRTVHGTTSCASGVFMTMPAMSPGESQVRHGYEFEHLLLLQVLGTAQEQTGCPACQPPRSSPTKFWRLPLEQLQCSAHRLAGCLCRFRVTALSKCFESLVQVKPLPSTTLSGSSLKHDRVGTLINGNNPMQTFLPAELDVTFRICRDMRHVGAMAMEPRQPPPTSKQAGRRSSNKLRRSREAAP